MNKNEKITLLKQIITENNFTANTSFYDFLLAVRKAFLNITYPVDLMENQNGINENPFEFTFKTLEKLMDFDIKDRKVSWAYYGVLDKIRRIEFLQEEEQEEIFNNYGLYKKCSIDFVMDALLEKTYFRVSAKDITLYHVQQILETFERQRLNIKVYPNDNRDVLVNFYEFN